MRTLFLPTAVLAVGFAVCLGAPLASAQAAFVLEDPVLVADGQRLPVEGAPLRLDRFGSFVLDVPRVGRYVIADAPFEGSRRAGEFDGTGLTFASDGVSVRLRGRRPILGTGRRPAYVRSAPSQRRSGAAFVQSEASQGRSTAETRREARTSSRPPEPAETRRSAEPLHAEVTRLRSQVSRLTAERDAATRENDQERHLLRATVDRMTRERAALLAERDRAIRERRQLAEAMQQVQREAERARERDARQMSQRDRAEAARLGAELDRLRREVMLRDASIELLTTERDDRSHQIARLESEVRSLRQERDAAIHERDAAVRERDAAIARLESLPRADDAEALQLRAEVRRLSAELDATRAERDRLAALTAVQSPDLAAQEGEMDRLMMEVEAMRTQLATATGQLQESEAARLSLEAEVAGLRSSGPASAAAQAEREAMIRERDQLRAEVEALQLELRRRSDEGSTPPPSSVPPRETRGPRAHIGLPGFDFGRLQNPDEVQHAIDAAALPDDHAEAEILVLFQTDDSGQVIRTAVPRPVGGGLDGVAEQIVRAMQFEPNHVDGVPTGLRSQVVIRFGADA